MTHMTMLFISVLAAASSYSYLESSIPTIKLGKTDVMMPMAGIGTWQYNSSATEEVVSLAFELGYTHVDTAIGYMNQDGVARALEKSGKARDSYFITSKIPGGLNFSTATSTLNECVDQLFPAENGKGYVDLMLIHYPATWEGKGGKELRQQEWRAMEAFQKAGRARAIGVSHYCKHHIDDILEINTAPIAVNQVQYHVGMGEAGADATDYKSYMKEKEITYESFSPLCGPCGDEAHNSLITGPMVSAIGKAHNKSGAQVSLKWQVQQNVPVIPKANVKAYLLENIDLFDWQLTDAEMAQLSAATAPAVAGNPGPPATSGDCDIE